MHNTLPLKGAISLFIHVSPWGCGLCTLPDYCTSIQRCEHSCSLGSSKVNRSGELHPCHDGSTAHSISQRRNYWHAHLTKSWREVCGSEGADFGWYLKSHPASSSNEGDRGVFWGLLVCVCVCVFPVGPSVSCCLQSFSLSNPRITRRTQLKETGALAFAIFTRPSLYLSLLPCHTTCPLVHSTLFDYLLTESKIVYLSRLGRIHFILLLRHSRTTSDIRRCTIDKFCWWAKSSYREEGDQIHNREYLFFCNQCEGSW